MKVQGRITPLKFSRNEIAQIKKKKIAAFMPILAAKRDEVKRKGHGGSLTSDRFQNNETVIATGRYNKKKDTTALSEIDIMSAMNAVIEEENIFIMPNERIVLNNPLDDDESALKATEAVERFESSELSRRLFPDMAKIDQAKRMNEAGTFRTMAEITSGFKAPTSRPIKVRGSTDKRIRAQIQGFKPSKAEILSSRESRRLRDTIRRQIYTNIANLGGGELDRKDVSQWLDEKGINREKLIDGLLKGYEKYIDKTPNTQMDFARIISAYHNTRLKNIPYLQRLAPHIDNAFKSKQYSSGFRDKFLHSISPTALDMTEAHPIHLIVDIEADEMEPEFKSKWWFDLFLGEIDPQKGPPLPALVKSEQEKSAMRLMANFGQDGDAAAKALLEASTKAFNSTRGMIDIGFSVRMPLLMPPDVVSEKVNDSIKKANDDRLAGNPFNDVFDLTQRVDANKQIMEHLVKLGLAFNIKYPQGRFKGKRESGFYLVPLFSGGFRKQPKGWSSKWVVPTIQILDEYAESASDSDSAISGLDLLFIIAARAKSLYNYNLKEAETVLLYTMLDPTSGDEPAEEVEEESSSVATEGLFDGTMAGRASASIMPYGANLEDNIVDDKKLKNFFKEISRWSTEQKEKELKRKKIWTNALKKLKNETGYKGALTKLPANLYRQAKLAKSEDDPVFKQIRTYMTEKVEEEKKKKEAEKEAKTDAIESSVTGEVKEAKRKDAGKKTKKNPALPATLQATGLENAKSIQDMVAADYGQEYVIMQKGNQYIVTSPKEIGKAVKKGFQSVMVEQNTGFTKEFVEANARGSVKSNPVESVSVAQTFPDKLDGRFEARDVGDFVAEHKGYVIETEISSNKITMKGSGTLTLMENAMVTFEQMKDPSNVIKYRDTMSQGFNPIFIEPDDDAQVIKTKGKSLLIDGYVNDGWRTFHKHGPSHLAQKISEVEELFSYGYDRANFIDGGYSLSQICRDKKGFYLWDGNEKLRFKTLNYIGKEKWAEAMGYEHYLRKVPEVKNKLKKLKDEELGAYAVKNPPPTIHYPTLALVRKTPKSSIKLILIHYKQELYDANVKKQMESMKKALDTKLKNSKKNPMTAECQECGHRQELKDFADKCEKCGSQGKWKSGEYTSSRKASHSCSYRKTKRSKECGGRVVKMKRNGDIYKCEDCNAKYQMR